MMKNFVLALLSAFLLVGCSGEKVEPQIPVTPQKPVVLDYGFKDGKISREVLENYLRRSITQTEFLSSPGFYVDPGYTSEEDDVRMLIELDAKFVGRAIYRWGREDTFNNPIWLTKAKEKADRMHRACKDMIFQASIFEIVTQKVNQLPVPAEVFEAFNLKPEERNFNYEAMLSEDGYGRNKWGNGQSVPDMGRLETQMYFYFMAISYMKAGCEAIHFGQILMMSHSDAKLQDGQTTEDSFAGWRSLLEKVRKAALKYARRGTVLCDAHVPSTLKKMSGLTVCGNIRMQDGSLLLDFGSFPMRPKNMDDRNKGKYPATLDVYDDNAMIIKANAIYRRTVGGRTPSGWDCEHSPYVVEFDNYGSKSSAPSFQPMEAVQVWGWDEISWFYHVDERHRNLFLEEAVAWLQKADANGFVQMPGSRVVTYANGGKARYRANTKSTLCPEGMSQEKTISEIWKNLEK